MNFAMSYSGGKDSALALYRMICGGHKPAALITTVNIEQERSWFHGVGEDLLESLSNCLNIPLIMCRCTPKEYEKAFEDGLIKSRKMGTDACVFGDIDIEAHRQWNEERCDKADLKCVLPLWGQDRETLVRETIEVGFKAKIKIVQSDILDESFLGKDLSIPLLEKIKHTDADVCGENGEYHTFVYDGPIFAQPLLIDTSRTIDLGKHKVIDITKVIPT